MKLHYSANYENLLHKVLFTKRVFHSKLRVSATGQPIIGYDFNLKNNVFLVPTLEYFGFDIFGNTLTKDALVAEQHYIRELCETFNRVDLEQPQLIFTVQEIINKRRLDTRYAEHSAFRRTENFAIRTDDNISLYLSSIKDNCERLVDEWLTESDTDIIKTNLVLLSRNCTERVALASLVYQGVLGFDQQNNPTCRELANAIAGDDRAEAWFQIRYNLNPIEKADQLTALYRYYESGLFGLYDYGITDLNIDKAICKNIYDVYNLHKEQILSYEKNFQRYIPDANQRFNLSSSEQIKTLEQCFSLAYNFVRNSAKNWPQHTRRSEAPPDKPARFSEITANTSTSSLQDFSPNDVSHKVVRYSV